MHFQSLMSGSLSFSVFLLRLSFCAAQVSNYCSISGQHSLCLNQGPSRSCGKVYYRGLTEAEKQEALDEHNRLRSLVATGGTRQPPASDMRELTWDDELARVAQARADSCEFGHECRDCRRVNRFKVGQNIYRARDNRLESPEWGHVIRSFFSEIDLFPGSGSIARYKYTPGTGHYTQMVWSSVTRVGCGLITFYNLDTAPLIARYYVCDYGPGGNKVGDVMYRPGPACSACPGGTSCSGRHRGLCSGQGVDLDQLDFIDNNSLDDGRRFSSRSGLFSPANNRPVNNQLRDSEVKNTFKDVTSSSAVTRRIPARSPVTRVTRPRQRSQRLRSRSRPCDFFCALGRIFRF